MDMYRHINWLQGLEILDQIGYFRIAQTQGLLRVVRLYCRFQRWRGAVVEIRRTLPQPAQRRGAVLLGRAARCPAGSAVRLRFAYHVARRVQPQVGIGELGSAVATRAGAGSFEYKFSACGGSLIEASRRRRWRLQSELIGL